MNYELASDGRKRTPKEIEKIAKLLLELEKLERSQFE